MGQRNKAKEYFASKVLPPNENGCMIWVGPRNGKGQGQFRYHGKTIKAARYAAGLIHSPSEFQTRHICHVRLCVNPDHLTFVIHNDNTSAIMDADKPVAMGDQ